MPLSKNVEMFLEILCEWIFQARERYKRLVSHRDVPELEELLSRQEYDMKDHTVSILELNIADLKEGSKWIGENKIEEEKEEVESEDSSDDDDDNDIIGMSLQEKQKLPVNQESKINNEEKKSLKDVKREIKKAALKRVKKSKAFQQKQKIEQQKNKKQSKRETHKGQKLRHGRKRDKQVKKKPGRR